MNVIQKVELKLTDSETTHCYWTCAVIVLAAVAAESLTG